jgi:arylsulfatase A-like enzyme
LLGLDGFPRAALSRELTPNLCSFGAAVGQTPDGGRAALPASTYPGFASLLTGCLPAGHGVWSTAINRVAPAWAGHSQVTVLTLFDLCRMAGLRSAAVQGDHLLHTVLRTDAADVCWPPGGNLPPHGTPLESHGYAANRAVRPHLLAAVADANLAFVFGQLNEVDSLGHDRGPDHPATLAACAETDAIVGEVLDALQPTWDRTLLIIVADHDMERRTAFDPIDVMANAVVRELADGVWPDGGSALMLVRPGAEPARAVAAVEQVEGIATTHWISPEVLVAGASPGRMFLADGYSAAGFHGGPATARPLTLVGGGHQTVAGISATLRSRAPHLVDWAPTITGLLGIEAPTMDGHDLTATGVRP